MNRKYSWPKGHWNWPVTLTHQHGVRAGDFIFTGGQADLDSNGQVRHPYDVASQVASVTDYMLAVLHDLDADANDLVRLVVYFVGDANTEAAILKQIGEIIGLAAQPVVNTIPVPQLCYPGMVIELEGVAMKRARDRVTDRENIRLDSLPRLPSNYSHVVRFGDVILTGDISAVTADGQVSEPGDVIAQTKIMMDQLGVALRACNVDFDDVLKLNVFYVGDGSAENWEKPALIRQARFNDPGPAATGITLPAFAMPGLMTKIAVTAMRSETGMAADSGHCVGNSGENSAATSSASRATDSAANSSANSSAAHSELSVLSQSSGQLVSDDKTDGSALKLARQYSWPQGHWDWTTPLPYKHGNRCGKLIHLGGQVSLDSEARVLDPDDIVAQTQRAMENVAKVLAELGATLDHVVKVTTFYQGGASADDLHQNLLVRSGSFSHPGPATSGIPVPSLVYKNMRVEIEVIAVLDD